MPEKVKYLSEIALEYGVHPHTIRNWLKPIWSKLKIRGRHSLMGWQVKLIYEFLDAPETLQS
jgi:DNA-binding CsgD family transcriptional regulator